MELRRLTSLRAFAALLVFAYHIRHDTQWLPIDAGMDSGYVGVAFFFVLSGFVLTWSTRPGSSAREFYTRRFARVYPSHFATAAAALLIPFTALPIVWPAIPPNLALVQAWFPGEQIAFGLNAVSWSLSCEAFFYLIAPFLIAWCHRRRTRTVITTLLSWWVAASAANVALGLASQAVDIAAYTNPALRSGEFVLGVLLAVAVLRGWLPTIPLWVPLVALAVCLELVSVARLPQTVADVLAVPACAFVVVAAAAADVSSRQGLLHRRAFTYAGEASYAFYLVHELVILNLAGMAGSGGTTKVRLLWMGIALVLSVIAAVALHELVEKPAQRLIKARWLRPLSERRRPDPTSAMPRVGPEP